MNNRSYLVGILVVVLLLLSGWWFWKSKRIPPAEAPVKTSPASPANTVTPNGTASQPGTPAGKSALTPEMLALEQNPKVKAMEKMMAEINAKPINVYGKVIDQFDQPVVGAKVNGGTLLMISFERSGGETVSTVTDAQGRFSFTGLHGARFGLEIEKAGYKYDTQLNVNWWNNYKPDPDNPAVFHMWKLQGAEPMVHTKFDSRVPYNGQAVAFVILTGRKTSSGDLQITLIRNPLQVQRGGAPFDWSVQIQVAGGGLVGTSDLYPDEAPEGGYQPTFAFSMTKDAANWTQRLTKTYYIHTANGDYGRVNIDLTTDSERPQGTGITIETWLNPVPGDRNLEFDPTQAIKP
jgi:hypothetical protein